jgi:hypothetical protein
MPSADHITVLPVIVGPRSPPMAVVWSLGAGGVVGFDAFSGDVLIGYRLTDLVPRQSAGIADRQIASRKAPSSIPTRHGQAESQPVLRDAGGAPPGAQVKREDV